MCDEDNWCLTHGKWFLPSHVPSLTSKLLDLSKTITGGNNSFNAPQIWTLILGGYGWVKKNLLRTTITRGCHVHLKRWLILYLWIQKQIKTCQISPFTQHCHCGRQPSHIMVQKCVEWIILLLIEGDQNKSSANLFSGLRSGGWCNDSTVISALP